MAKTKISEFSSTPGNNTDIDSINIAEGCAPSGINNAIRELMAQLKDFQTGAAGDSFNGPIGTSTAAAGAFTTLSASGNVTLAALTSTRVPYASTGGLLVDSANMTFNGTRLTVADLADSGLTAGRVTYASTGGALVDSANLTFDGTTLTAAGLAGPFNGTVGSTTASTGAFTTLTTSGAVTHNAGTANGVAYLNGSKVLTTGSALTFDGTNLTFNSTGQRVYAVMSGSTLSNRLYFQTSVVNAQTSFSIIPNGTNRQSQYVSYNANDPANASRANIGVDSTSAYFVSDLTGTGSYLPITFSVAGSEQMRLTSTGLGIGTSSPVYRLHLAGNGAAAGMILQNNSGAISNAAIRWQNSSGTFQAGIASYFNVADTGNIEFLNGSTTNMMLSSSGNLGLGVTPSAWAVYKSFDSGSCSFNTAGVQGELTSNGFFNASSQWIYKATGFANRYVQNLSANGVHAWYTAPSGTAGNAISFTQAMSLTADGNLAVGLTSTSFRVNATVQSGANRDVFAAQIAGASNGLTIKWNHATTTTRVNISNLPTSASGLASGDLWNDGGTLKIA